jgi:hypothetical protein
VTSLPVTAIVPARGPQQPRQRLDEGRLARAVGADHGENGFRRLIEIDAADDVAAVAVAGAQTMHGERGTDLGRGHIENLR